MTLSLADMVLATRDLHAYSISSCSNSEVSHLPRGN